MIYVIDGHDRILREKFSTKALGIRDYKQLIYIREFVRLMFGVVDIVTNKGWK